MSFYFGFCDTSKTSISTYPNISTIVIFGIDQIFNMSIAASNVPLEQPLLVSYCSEKDISSAWIIDTGHKPFQISGPINTLLNGGEIIDCTIPYLESYNSAFRLIMRGLKSLSLNELEGNELQLRLWIENSYNKTLKQNANWKQSKGLILESLNLITIPDTLRCRVSNVIQKMSTPSQQSLRQNIDINMHGYPEFTMLRN